MDKAKTWGPFTGRQLTVIIITLVVGIVMIPSSVWAVDAFQNVAVEDPVSGTKASVDAGRALKVGDGSGALTVDGTVSSRPALNAKAWSNMGYAAYNYPATIHGPSAVGMAITNLTVTNNGSSTVTVQPGVYYSNGFYQLLLYKIAPGQTVVLPFDQGGFTEKTTDSSLKLAVVTSGGSVFYMATGYDL